MAEATYTPFPNIAAVVGTVVPAEDMAPTTPSDLDSSPLATPEPQHAELNFGEPLAHHDSPLYTEINIPLPALPQPPSGVEAVSSPATAHLASPSQSRSRAHTVHSISPFQRHRNRSSSPEEARSERPQQPRQQHPNHHGLSLRTLARGRSRSGTIDAAIIPAVLVLKAELFTPSEATPKRGLSAKDGLK